jgi:hypothetical protein
MKWPKGSFAFGISGAFFSNFFTGSFCFCRHFMFSFKATVIKTRGVENAGLGCQEDTGISKSKNHLPRIVVKMGPRRTRVV